MADNKEINYIIKELSQSKNLNFAKLLELSLILTKNENIENGREYIGVLNDIFNSKKEVLNNFQKFIFAKIMITLLSRFSQLFQDNEKNKFKNIYDNGQFQKDEILKQFDNSNKNLDDIIINIIKKFLQLFSEEDGNKEIIANKNKYLEYFSLFEHFEIKEKIKDELSQFLLSIENIEIANYFQEIDLIKNIKNNPKILEEIYDYIKYKLIIKEKKKLIKYLADKERKNDDYGRESAQIEGNNNNMMDNSDGPQEKLSKNIIKKIMNEKLILIYDLTNYNIEPEAKCGNEKVETIHLREKAEYDRNKFEEKNYIQYLKFIEEVNKYIKEKKNNIKLKTTITLELTPISGKQEIGITLPRNFSDNQNVLNIYNVECKSSFNYKGQEFIYKDKNVLIFGIHGKAPGFIFLINELCNDDYKK